MELKINTSIPVSFERVEGSDNRFLPVKVEVAHTGTNLNNSSFSKEVLEKIGQTIAGVPIVGFLSEDAKGNVDFKGHEMKIVVTEDGVDYTYLGSAFGCILENCNPRFETKICDDGVSREYLVVDGILWRKFDKYTDIFEKDGFRSQSMELLPESIKGQFSDDKVFHFQEATVEALCALGIGVNPAMKNSTITKYSLSTIKEQFKEMFEELKQYNSQFENSTSSNHDGAFSIDGSHDDSTNNFNTSKKEDEQVPEAIKTKAEIAEMFSLTVNQLYEELSRKVSEKTYKTKNWYDEEVERSKFYMKDFDDNFVYAVDREQGYIDVKIPYSKNGDDVSFDFEKASRIKWSPMDWEGSSEQDVEVENFTVKVLEEVKKDFDKAVEEKNEVNSKLEKNADALLELNAKYTSLEETLSEKDTLLTAKEEELDGLKEFKLRIETEERKDKVNKLYEKYKKNLTKEDIDSFNERESTFSLFEDFEKEVKLFVADKIAEVASVDPDVVPAATFTTMGIFPDQPHDSGNSKFVSVWDKLKESNN